MKKFLILLSIALAASTTGLIAADAVTTPPAATESAPGTDTPARTGKHRKHKKQSKKAHKKHHREKTDQAAPAAPAAPAQ